MENFIVCTVLWCEIICSLKYVALSSDLKIRKEIRIRSKQKKIQNLINTKQNRQKISY